MTTNRPSSSPVEFLVGQEDHPALARLAERFGLQAAYVALLRSESTGPLVPPAVELRFTVDRLDRLLTAACRQLGIATTAWGRVAPVLQAVERLPRPGGSAAQRPTEAYGHYAPHDRRVSVAMGRPAAWTERREARLVTTLVHEWVHALDHWAVCRHATSLPAGTFLSELAQRPLGPLATVAPDALVRSARLMARIQDELHGRTPPSLDPQPWSRFRAWAHARRWNRAAQRWDGAQGRAYYARGQELLARAVQFHARGTLNDVMRLPLSVTLGWGAVPELPSRPLHGTVALIRTWMALEGVATVERAIPDLAPGPTQPTEDASDARVVIRPGRSALRG